MICIVSEPIQTGQLISLNSKHEILHTVYPERDSRVVGVALRDFRKGENVKYYSGRNTTDIITKRLILGS